MTCEATRNRELFCTNPARFITLVCRVCRQRFDYVLCADHAMSLRCARDGVLLEATT